MTVATMTVDELVRMVDTDPRRVVEISREQLDHDSVEVARSAHLWWVNGLAERLLGHLAAAREALQRSRALAEAAGDRALMARVTISLALEVAYGGDIGGAMELLAGAENDVDDADRARLANQRGILHYRLGHLDAAVTDLDHARLVASRDGDRVTELQALVNLGAIHSERADYRAARRSLDTAIALATELDQVATGALAHANLAYVATIEGDLPSALNAFAAAEEGYRRAGSLADLPRLHADHALALADANLLDDAEHLIDRALELSRSTDNDLEMADLLLASAEIDLARGAADEAREAAEEAGKRFERQGRESRLDIAARLRLRAEAQLVPDDPALADELVVNGRSLAANGWRSEALASVLLAALLHARAGRDEAAETLLGEVRQAAARGRATDVILLKRVVALLAKHRGDRAAARRAINSGLRVAAASQAALGSLETRSYAAQHGAALIELGAHLAVDDRRPRELLRRIEAMRTMVWHTPLVRPPDDARMASALAELRRLGAVLADPEASLVDRREAERHRLHLERTIRGVTRRARGQRSRGRAIKSTKQAVAEALADLTELGDRQLLAYANLEGDLLAVSADHGRCRLHRLGPVEALGPQIDACTFALTRLNRAQGSEASRAAAWDSLGEAADALSAQLVPPAIARSDRPLLVVPTGALNSVPWTALGRLRGREVVVSPSLSGWSIAARGRVSRVRQRGVGLRDQPVGFVAGPALRFAEHEVRTLAQEYQHVQVLGGPDATADRCLDLFAGAELVHLACHGAFRTDNALFSTLSLADGPLTVYDLERASHTPEIVVLSACSVASSAAIDGGTLLGLASALMTFGASTVVAPLTPVNDEWVVDVMLALHRSMATGASPAAALAAANETATGAVAPTAAAFVAMGA